MLIKIIGEHIETGEQRRFYMDNQTGRIADDVFEPSAATSRKSISDNRKVGPFKRIKIQLGLSCNYECSYCSQRFVERPPETSKKDIDDFMSMFDALPKVDGAFRVEFWGGEPLVYWKTLKPLAERIRGQYPQATFSMISNGSLLTHEIVDWLDFMGFGVSISHDGPGQSVRGPDPFVENIEVFRYLLQKLTSQRVGFSSMLNRQNQSRKAIVEYYEALFPGEQIMHNEMDLIDAHDEGGLDSIDFALTEHFQIRRDMWAEARFNPQILDRCSGQRGKISALVLKNGSESRELPDEWLESGANMKCGMDVDGNIALDLRGNVMTCQNTSAVAVSDNGKSHKIGHATDLLGIRMETSMHWTERPHCAGCPVLSMCKGSCMFLDGANWHKSCDAQFSNNVALFALAFEKVTGFVPVAFDVEHLPKHRQDIWGSRFDWSHEQEKPKHKMIRIKEV